MDSRYWEEEGWASPLWPYLILFRALLDGILSVQAFEVLFLSHYKNDPTRWTPALFNVLEAVFGAVDEYVEDDQLRVETQGLGEEGVRSTVTRALAELADLKSREAASDG